MDDYQILLVYIDSSYL